MHINLKLEPITIIFSLLLVTMTLDGRYVAVRVVSLLDWITRARHTCPCCCLVALPPPPHRPLVDGGVCVQSKLKIENDRRMWLCKIFLVVHRGLEGAPFVLCPTDHRTKEC